MKKHHDGKVQSILNDIPNIKLKPDVQTFNLILQWLHAKTDITKMEETWQQMMESNIEPDVESYGTMIAAYVSLEEQPTQKIEELWTAMRDSGLDTSENVHKRITELVSKAETTRYANMSNSKDK